MNKFLFHHQWGLHLIMLALFILFSLPSKAQSQKKDLENNSFQFEVNIESLRSQFLEAPMEFKSRKSKAAFQIELPDPKGQFNLFDVVESPIMEPSGEALYNYKSYKAVDPISGNILGRFSISDNGLSGIFTNEEGLFSIGKNEQNKHIAFFKSEKDNYTHCGNIEEKIPGNDIKSFGKSEFSVGRDLKVFKIGLTCTGEFGARAKQLFQSAQVLMADQINQVNFIFEKELSIKLQVITPIKIHTNSSTDPFTDFSTLALISKARTVIDGLYAGHDFQLGHLITLHGGGRAYIASVCRSLKSGAVSGMSIPASINNIRLFAHEIGHQFGAGHSFNGRASYCGSNIFPKSAYEIGSGATIMSYAGSCHPENVVNQRTGFFNAGAQQEIFNLISSKNVCWSNSQTGNIPPNISTSGTKYIPARTPFILKGQGSDQNGDALTYSWEQSDLQSSADVNFALPQNRTAPLFRVYDPSTNPNRIFPALDHILTNDNKATFEVLPEISRDLYFKLVVRDARGGSSAKTQLVKVHNTGQAFRVHSFNTAETIAGGSSKLINWNVAGTNFPPISAGLVNIKMSIDGGANFNINLASNVPNDGNHSVIIPNQTSDNARIMIEASDNIFFDINNAPIKIIGYQPVPCAISEIRMINKSGCFDNGTANTSDDYFTANIQVFFANKPTSGNLQLTGIANDAKSVSSFGSSAYTFSNIRIPSDGRAMNLTAYFTNNSACRYTKYLGYAPAPCSQPDPISNLQMSLSSDKSEYVKNQAITIDVTVVNRGNFAEKNIAIKIPLSFGKLGYSNASSSHGSYNLFTNEWVIPSLEINHSANLKLRLFPLVEGEQITVLAEILGKRISKTVTIRPLVIAQKPDLQLVDLVNLYSGNIGDFFTAKLKILNAGNNHVSEQFRVGVYFSKDQNFDANAPIAGEGIITFAPIGETFLDLGFHLPSSITPGSYYLIFKVDKNNKIDESNENNNLSVSQIQLSGNLPVLKTDLELSSTASQTTLSDGTTQIIVSVKNNGVGEASGIVIKHYPNAKFSTYLPGSFLMSQGIFDQYTKEWKINSLPPGATSTLRFQERIIGLNNLDSDFIQVVKCNEDDVDSTPNNGNTFHKNPVEDDETAIIFSPAIAASSDLKLTIASNNIELLQNETGRVTFYLKNDGPDATSAKVKINLNQFNFESSSSNNGHFNLFNNTWEIPNLKSGYTAYLILDIYAANHVNNTDISVFGEVIESQNPDPDSTPNNGRCCTEIEDDEAGRNIRIIQQQCSFNSNVSDLTCNDNGTPTDPSDDTYHFSMSVQNGSSTGEWEGVVAGIYRRVSYGQTIFVGPLNIENGRLNFEINDLDNPSCKTSIVVNPPTPCSNEIAPNDYCEAQSIYPWYEWIAGVQVGSFSNLSGKSKYTFYESKPIKMYTGSINQVRFTGGYSWYSFDEYWRAWMDSNKNGIFEGNELVFQTIIKKSFNGLPTKSINGIIYLGNNVQPGKSRIRIAVQRDKFPEPCGDITLGEVEDYPVEFIKRFNSKETNVPTNTTAMFVEEVLLFPNPAKEELNIRTAFDIEKIQIKDAQGRFVSEELHSFEKLNLKQLSNGLYWAVIFSKDSNERITKRFVVQR